MKGEIIPNHLYKKYKIYLGEYSNMSFDLFRVYSVKLPWLNAGGILIIAYNFSTVGRLEF